MYPTTVYPARADAFAAVSFRTTRDALEYISGVLRNAPSGICTCPASSYERHYPDTVVAGREAGKND